MTDKLLNVQRFWEGDSQAGHLQFPHPDAPTSTLLSGFQLVGQEVRREEGEDLAGSHHGATLYSSSNCSQTHGQLSTIAHPECHSFPGCFPSTRPTLSRRVYKQPTNISN